MLKSEEVLLLSLATLQTILKLCIQKFFSDGTTLKIWFSIEQVNLWIDGRSSLKLPL